MNAEKEPKPGDDIFTLPPLSLAGSRFEKRDKQILTNVDKMLTLHVQLRSVCIYLSDNKLTVDERINLTTAFCNCCSDAEIGLLESVDKLATINQNELYDLKRDLQDYSKRCANFLADGIKQGYFNKVDLRLLEKEHSDWTMRLLDVQVTHEARVNQEGNISLPNYMREHCRETGGVNSKANRIHEYVRSGKITFMPKPENNPKGRQTKLYRKIDLDNVWDRLRTKMPKLPKKLID